MEQAANAAMPASQGAASSMCRYRVISSSSKLLYLLHTAAYVGMRLLAAAVRASPLHGVLLCDLVLHANSADCPPAPAYSVAWPFKHNVEVHACNGCNVSKQHMCPDITQLTKQCLEAGGQRDLRLEGKNIRSVLH